MAGLCCRIREKPLENATKSSKKGWQGQKTEQDEQVKSHPQNTIIAKPLFLYKGDKGGFTAQGILRRDNGMVAIL
jgi:hypothetical protein